jgi:hypothetical protein
VTAAAVVGPLAMPVPRLPLLEVNHPGAETLAATLAVVVVTTGRWLAPTLKFASTRSRLDDGLRRMEISCNTCQIALANLFNGAGVCVLARKSGTDLEVAS